ncbi:MAG: DUF1565 domain-containing protein [Synechococcus sp.]
MVSKLHSQNTRSWMGIASGVLVALLASCAADTDPVGTTQCSAAIARASYRWRVDYSPRRSTSSRIQERSEFFEGSELINRNREEPDSAVSGPDGDGIWWPALPPRPSPETVDNAAERLEDSSELTLVRKVDYFLQCEDGDLSTDRRTYRQTSTAFRSGETVEVSYGLGRVMQVLRNTDGSSSNAGNPDASESSESDREPNTDSRNTVESGNTIESQTPQSPQSVATPPNRSTNRAEERGEVETTAAILHVNPIAGSDANTGSLDAPFQTISRALTEAKTGDIIRLADGSYSEATGEEFPLIVGEGIALVGDELRRGMNIRVIGGGRYLSATWGGQTVTVVAGDRTRISGITFTNEDIRGTAIWVESGVPSIANNTFVANHREGVFASGTSAPEVRANVFSNNGGNGISFTRHSSGVFEGNTVSDSGYGVSISGSASPVVVGNTISNNRSGVLVTGAARPILRENTITRNREDGIVAIGSSAPIIQENAIAQNGQFDVHNATNTPLAIEGSDLAVLSVQGGIQE